MSNCCENPIDLGCVSSCDDVVTNITASCAQQYLVTFEFNGATFSRRVSHNDDAGYFTIPAGTFNENYNTTFQVYDQAGEFVACYKVKTTPSASFDYGDSESGALTSTIEIEPSGLCDDGLGGSTLPILVTITVPDINLLQNGSTITLDSNITGGTLGSFTAVSTGITIAGSTITITDIDELVGNEIQVQLNILLTGVCFSNYTANVIVSCYTNLPSGTAVGTQTISNTLINEYNS